jgi:hypothetical protein
MSHLVEIETQIRDRAAVAAACQRLNLPPPVDGTTELFSGAVTGLAVQLPGWNYPVVCDLATGRIKYDNFGGQWGDQKELDHFLQLYVVEKARIEALNQGHSVIEQTLPNHFIKVTINVGRGAT